MKEINIIELAKLLGKQWKAFIKWSVIGATIGIVIAISIPKQYSSTVEVVVEKRNTQDGTTGSMSAFAGMMGVNLGGSSDDLSSELYPKIVKSPLYLKEFYGIDVDYKGKKTSLYDYMLEHQKKPWWKYITSLPAKTISWVAGLWNSSAQQGSGEAAYDITRPSSEQSLFEFLLCDAIKVNADKKTKIVAINVQMQDPVIAAQIADSVFAKLQRYVIEYRTEKARADLQFSENLLKKTKLEYYTADSAFASVADRNQNLITKLAMIKLERFKNERDIAFSVYQQIANKVEMDRIKLQEQTPIATVIFPAQVNPNAISPSKMRFIIGFAFLLALYVFGRTTLRYMRK